MADKVSTIFEGSIVPLLLTTYTQNANAKANQQRRPGAVK